MTTNNLTELWKKGELDRNKLYYYETPFMTTDSASGFWLSNTLDKEKDKVKILSEVPSYEEWQSLNELLDSMQDTNKALAHRLNMLKELLKECKSSVLFEADVVKETSGKHSKDYKMLASILTKINEVLK